MCPSNEISTFIARTAGQIPTGLVKKHANLHRMDGDGEGRVVPVPFWLLPSILISFRALLVGGVNAIDAQDHNDHQGGNAHHYNHCGCWGRACDQTHKKEKGNVPLHLPQESTVEYNY